MVGKSTDESSQFPVFAFAEDLGSIQQTSAPLVWAAANLRDLNGSGAVTYTDLSKSQQTRNLYYRSSYTDAGVLVSIYSTRLLLLSHMLLAQ